ncbi:hypothetical protein [Ferruginivarius sediminum]|uniref:hypothetical protein n=1 Tax=Ferruginivarius sediminum TaxID=2661937 RepID=UPI001293B876|nr:hypothetical protein [Ferruginivarius sediminum]
MVQIIGLTVCHYQNKPLGEVRSLPVLNTDSKRRPRIDRQKVKAAGEQDGQ